MHGHIEDAALLTRRKGARAELSPVASAAVVAEADAMA